MDDSQVARDARLMVQIVARPDSPFRFRFTLSQDGLAVGEVEHLLWGRPGRLRIGNDAYSIVRAGSRRWRLDGGSRPVSAAPTGALRYSYQLDWAGGTLVANRRGVGYGMRLTVDGEEVGRSRVRNPFTRTLIVDVSDAIPLEVIGLVVYLAIRMRRRAVTSSGGA